MQDVSFLLPVNAWAYLLGLKGCKTLWCFPETNAPDTGDGYRYLLREGLALTDSTTVLVDPYLLQLSQEMALGEWCAIFEGDVSAASMVIGHTSFLFIRRISAVLYRIEPFDSEETFFDKLYDQLTFLEWDAVEVTLATPSRVAGKKTVSREELPSFVSKLMPDRKDSNGR